MIQIKNQKHVAQDNKKLYNLRKKKAYIKREKDLVIIQKNKK